MPPVHGKQFAFTMSGAVFGAVLLGNIVTIAADWFMHTGTPNAPGVVGAIVGGISAGAFTIRHMTQQNLDRECDSN